MAIAPLPDIRGMVVKIQTMSIQYQVSIQKAFLHNGYLIEVKIH